ncbi:MAG: acyl-CoA dehydrogenase [Bacteroidetes bacterium]|nr:acyl-CoA dehydrogenase [Bacteroidota bacterium]MBU1423646.1 acyl-CoA dehydrogenase [Bacteroidota bacterium]MBU2635694.1 acyl-CoA dehydrogenase [Bacteroidota bacterium]
MNSTEQTIPTFEITENQKMVQQLARDFAEKEIKPVIMKYDESQEFPLDIVRKMSELGFMGIIFPEEYGGAGFGYLEYVTIIEEISKADPSMGLTIAAHNSLCTNHIYTFGNEQQKKKYLPDLCSGKKIGAWALTEPTSGSDAGSMRTTAMRDGNYYILNGSKNFITHGSVGKVTVVLAITDKSKGKKGISAFIVDNDTPGFIVNKKENKLGMRSSDTTALAFDNCAVPIENLIGEECKGFHQALTILDGGRISIAANALGIAQGAFDASLKYSKERQQFGKPISEFQAIQWKLSEMATQIEAARLLTYRAAFLKNKGDEIIKESSMAKYYASEVAVMVTNEAVQIHGGYGFTKDFIVEKFYRDVKLVTIGEGTSEIQKLVISRELLRI